MRRLPDPQAGHLTYSYAMRNQPPVATQAASALVCREARPSAWIGSDYALIGALLLLAAGAWVASDLRMAGMDTGPGGDPGALGFYVVTWLVMMTAMMVPSLGPLMLAHRGLHRDRQRGGYAPAGTLLLAGYLAVWVAAGVAGYALLQGGRELAGGALAWDGAGRWAAAAVLLVAALYELTRSKQACLTRCRTPTASLREHWRGGHGGALRLGARHGVVCLGCCSGLMAALFALGVMSLVWMSVVSAAIAAEKLLPWRGLAVAATASILAALAVGIGAAPAHVPGLTLPGSAKAMQAMRSMGMAGSDPMAGSHPMAGPRPRTKRPASRQPMRMAHPTR
jgi:predicted metal-binding membrane protein